MLKRHRFKQTTTLDERLRQAADQLRAQAQQATEIGTREALLRQARQIDETRSISASLAPASN